MIEGVGLPATNTKLKTYLFQLRLLCCVEQSLRPPPLPTTAAAQTRCDPHANRRLATPPALHFPGASTLPAPDDGCLTVARYCPPVRSGGSRHGLPSARRGRTPHAVDRSAGPCRPRCGTTARPERHQFCWDGRGGAGRAGCRGGQVGPVPLLTFSDQ